VVEGARLEIVYIPKGVSRVRIPLSPPVLTFYAEQEGFEIVFYTTESRPTKDNPSLSAINKFGKGKYDTPHRVRFGRKQPKEHSAVPFPFFFILPLLN
jgi:hypothetical protein